MKGVLKRDRKPQSNQEPSPPSKDYVDGPSSAVQSSGEKETSKTRLLSRIAKLGQPILPLSGAVVAEESDSEQVNLNLLFVHSLLGGW